MSRAKLFNMIKSRGEKPVGRNAFDLQNRHVYPQKIAKIYPVKALHTIPKDYFQISMSEFSQNNIPMNTAAFLSGTKELLAYFVPYNSVWHNFNQYQATREDPESAALKVKGISYEPRFSLNMLYHAALYFSLGAWMYESYSKLLAPYLWYTTFRNHATSSAWNDFANSTFGADNQAYLSELVEFMKRGHYVSDALTDWEYFCRKASQDVSKWNFADLVTNSKFPFAESHSCYEYYIEHKASLTYGDTILNMFGTPIWCDWIMKLDLLRYGNVYPILHNLRVNLDKAVDAILSDSHGSYLNNTNFYFDSDLTLYKNFVESYEDCFNLPEFEDPFTFATMKINAASTVHNSGDATDDEYVNVYPLYSYNKCFYDYMRNVYFDTDYSVYNYNCDFVDCTDWETSIIHRGYLPCRFYHLESHQWKKDMFTAVLPSNQLGQISSVVIDVTSNGWLSNDGQVVVQGSGEAQYDSVSNSPTQVSTEAPSGGTLNTNLYDEDYLQLQGDGDTFYDVQFKTPHTHQPRNYYVDGLNGRGSFNVLSLKRAEVLQQYAQDLMRAGNRTQDIFNQIYGSTPKSELDETPYFIDVASSPLNINPIVSTASTGQDNNGRLGDIAARALIDGRNHPLNFKFSTEDFGVILFLSYIIPESMYNSYSLDPHVTHLDPESHCLPYFQNLGLQPVIGSFLNNLKPIDIRSRVLGYAPPYIEFKTDVDLVHGNLVDTFLPSVGEGDTESEYQGDLSHWVVARTDMQQEDTVSLRNFYIDPRIVDNVFQFNADSDLSTDHFLTYSTIQVDAVRALSEIGLPRF